MFLPKVKVFENSVFSTTEKIIRKYSLNTVCQESLCPNIFECFSFGHATFMILGKVCTRACKYCHVSSGKPSKPDPSEPIRLYYAVKELNLRYVVITSVDRDDLEDGGAKHFKKCIDTLKSSLSVFVEALTPDFMGKKESLEEIITSKADVLAHNIETVQRIFPFVRPQGSYKRSLEVLKFYKNQSDKLVKSSFMVGLGEDWDDILKTLEDLKVAGVDIVVVGQYLRPSNKHYPVVRYYTEEDFLRIEETAKSMGFKKVLCKPLARSSYHAHHLV